jgi:small GTP-binding protein
LTSGVPDQGYVSSTAAQYKVILVGDTSSGKTALFNRLLKSSYEDVYQPSTRVQIGVKSFSFPRPNNLGVTDLSRKRMRKKGGDVGDVDSADSLPQIVHLQIWDCPGQGTVDMRSHHYKDVSCVIIVLDARLRREDVERSVASHVSSALEHAGPSVPIVVMLSKIDFASSLTCIRSEFFTKKLRTILRITKVWETSAMLDIGVHSAFRAVARYLMAHDARYGKFFASTNNGPGSGLQATRQPLPAHSGANPRKMFGVPLQSLLQSENRHRVIPELVDVCVPFLRKYGPRSHDLFADREGGSDTVTDWKIRLENAGNCQILWQCDEPQVVAAVFRAFLSELPEPLIPRSLQEQFLNVIKRDDIDAGMVDQKVYRLKQLWIRMERPERYLLRTTLRLLHYLSSFSEKTGASSQRISAFFSMSLVHVDFNAQHSPEQSIVSVVRSWQTVVEIMIRHAPMIFSVTGVDAAFHSETNPSEYDDVAADDGFSDRLTDRDAHTESLAGNSDCNSMT